MNKAVDPIDGVTRVVVGYRVGNATTRERLILEPAAEHVEDTIAAIQNQIAIANSMKTKWDHR